MRVIKYLDHDQMVESVNCTSKVIDLNNMSKIIATSARPLMHGQVNYKALDF